MKIGEYGRRKRGVDKISNFLKDRGERNRKYRIYEDASEPQQPDTYDFPGMPVSELSRTTGIRKHYNSKQISLMVY